MAPRPFLRSEYMGSSIVDSAPSAIHICHLQRLRAFEQDAFEEREFFDTLISTEVAADKRTTLMMAYISRSRHNHWALLEQLLTAGELDIVLSKMALSRLSETEYLRLEALVEEAEWA